jgi:hypothetical protein
MSKVYPHPYPVKQKKPIGTEPVKKRIKVTKEQIECIIYCMSKACGVKDCGHHEACTKLIKDSAKEKHQVGDIIDIVGD